MRVLSFLIALLCISPVLAADYRDYEPVLIFSDDAPDATGDLMSGWMESPIEAGGVLIQCWLQVTTAGVGIQASVQVPNDTDAGTVPVYGGGVTYVIETSPNSSAGVQNHNFTIYPVGTPASDLLAATGGTGKKAYLPGKWRLFIDGAAASDYTVDFCEALYLR